MYMKRKLLFIIVVCISLLHVHACAFMEIFSPTSIIRLLFVSPPINGEWENIGFMMEYLFHSLITGLISGLLLGWNDVKKWLLCIVLLGCPLFLIVYICIGEFYLHPSPNHHEFWLEKWAHQIYGYYGGFLLVLFGFMQVYVIITYRFLNIDKCKELFNQLTNRKE